MLIKQLSEFTGEGWEQEDDVTIVTLVNLPKKDEPDPPEGDQSESWRYPGGIYPAQ